MAELCTLWKHACISPFLFSISSHCEILFMLIFTLTYGKWYCTSIARIENSIAINTVSFFFGRQIDNGRLGCWWRGQRCIPTVLLIIILEFCAFNHLTSWVLSAVASRHIVKYLGNSIEILEFYTSVWSSIFLLLSLPMCHITANSWMKASSIVTILFQHFSLFNVCCCFFSWIFFSFSSNFF